MYKRLLGFILLLLVFIPFDIVWGRVDSYFVSADRTIDISAPNTNQNCHGYADIGSWSAYGGHVYRYLFKLDLNSVSVPVDQITKVIFKIKQVSATWDEGGSYEMRLVSGVWDPVSVSWGNQPTLDPGVIIMNGRSFSFFSADITDIVKGWLKNPLTNNGLLIKKVNEDISLYANVGSFACSSYPVGGAEAPPVLEITSCFDDEWTCVEFGVCNHSGIQSRTCTKTLDCPNVDTPMPVTTQQCVAPTCEQDTWNCSDWNICSALGDQTRVCQMAFDCPDIETPSPNISQNCTPPCYSDTWDCNDWSVCPSDGLQTRICNKTNDCPTANSQSPITTQNCTPTQPTCTADTWTCDSWGSCSLSGLQSRGCVKTFDCSNVQSAPPLIEQYCEATNKPTSTVPSESEEILNQDTIIKATIKLICPVDEIKASQGSGTVIDSAGTIVTNKHVVVGTLGCLVGFIDDFNDEPYFGDRQIADIVNFSADQDIAILKIRNPNNKKLSFVDITKWSNNFALGTRIITYGYPAKFGTRITYTSGDFSGSDSDYLKTTAILEYGNSGGGAYLKNGTFIGIPSAVVRGELNALGYILSINKILAWFNNSTIPPSNTNNNYSRVSVLENIDLKKLSFLKLFIPNVDKNGNLVESIPVQSSKKSIEKQKDIQPQVNQPQPESVIIETKNLDEKGLDFGSANSITSSSVFASTSSASSLEVHKASLFKRFIEWFVDIFNRLFKK